MTVYANLVNDEIKGVYDLIPKKWNNIENFDLKCLEDENFMRENNFVKIIRDTSSYDDLLQKKSDFPSYSVANGNVYEHRDIIDIPIETRESKLNQIRNSRDQLMKEFEWRYNRFYRQTRLGLATTDTIESLDQYMQDLADITAIEDVDNVQWPVWNGSN